MGSAVARPQPWPPEVTSTRPQAPAPTRPPGSTVPLEVSEAEVLAESVEAPEIHQLPETREVVANTMCNSNRLSSRSNRLLLT